MCLVRRSLIAASAFAFLLVPAALGHPCASQQMLQPGTATPIPPGSKAYRQLTDNPRSTTNFNVEVVRGFALIDVGGAVPDIFAINAYESTLLHFSGLTPQPVARWRTLTNPVSVAPHAGDLLVVGQGNHALVRHSAQDGSILDYLALPSEPACIVVDEDNDEAWVSCMGDDAVVQIELTPEFKIKKIWSWSEGLRLKRPRFLFLDRRSDPADNVVYVAPMVSGNNTLFLSSETGPDIVDGNTLPGGGLPDEDLFRISTQPDMVEPVVRSAGSLMLAHGLNPVTGDYWQLGVDHLNIEAGMLSEPTVRGKFARNQLAITSAAALATGGSPPPQPDSIIDLDDYDIATPGEQYQSKRSLSFPYALAFEQDTGRAAIASSTTPLVVITDSNGLRLQEFPLNAPGDQHRGTVARTVELFDGGLYVYCQESSNILAFRSTGGAALVSWDLGNDPTPEPVQAGRRIWYDGTRSLDGRTTCNTCHPQGGADGLAWLISNNPVDEKGNMVTQSLFGVEDSFPYHWRGERDLEAFNGAFPGLLGTADKLDELDGELEDFVEFIFSLTAPANSLQSGPMGIDPDGRLVQDLPRRLKASLFPDPIGVGIAPVGNFPPPATGDPVAGDAVFHDFPIVFGRTCEECHQNPSGSNGAVVTDAGGSIASAAVMKVAHLDTQLTLKHQPIVQVDTGAAVKPYNLLGFGTSHKGNRTNLFQFNLRFFGPNAFDATQVLDLTAFLHLADNGIAPSAHFGERLHAGSPAPIRQRIRNWLLSQAKKGWVGVIAFGTSPDMNGVPVRISWRYDPGTKLFFPDDVSLADPRPFSAFRDFANHPQLDNVFLGVAPGNERRLGTDFDNDGLDTGQELAAGTGLWNPDSDGDGWPDGYELANGGDPLDNLVGPDDTTAPKLVGSVELDFVNARAAKLYFEADEPVTWEITLSAADLPDVVEDRRTADRIHTALVQRLAPSTLGFGAPLEVQVEYRGTLVLRDLSGNSSDPIDLPLIRTRSQLHNGGPDKLVMGKLELVNEVRAPTSFGATADLRVDFREQAPPALAAGNRVVVAQLLKRDPNGLDWLIVLEDDIVSDAPATDFGFGSNGEPYGETPGLLPGPFLVLAPTESDGTRSVTFTVLGLSASQEVMLNVLAVFKAPPGWNPQDPVLTGNPLGEYHLPATLAPLRRVISTQ